MKKITGYLVLLCLVLLTGCSPESSDGVKVIGTGPVSSTIVDSLPQNVISLYAKINPCYLPLLKDSLLWEKGKRIGFSFNSLFNDSLPANNAYRARYLVGDFDVLDEQGRNKGMREINPSLKNLSEFKNVPDTLVQLFEQAILDDSSKSTLYSLVKQKLGDSANVYLNFFEKVWKYKTPTLIRDYGIAGSKVYASGQNLCLCEARRDTLILIGKFAVSAKRLDFSIREDDEGNEIKSLVELLPIKNFRNYYAGKNRITSKNWEVQRKYEQLDIDHDNKVGGGNNRITFYKGATELPNFLLMEPDKEYPRAMHQNGIHEAALPELSRGMLGSPHSIGCIRTSNFASKFLRWWTPQNCNYFILYKENQYSKDFPNISVESLHPFKTIEEGNLFRSWINEKHPLIAQSLKIDLKGDYRSGYLFDAYYLVKDEYNKYISNNKLSANKK